MRGNVTWPYRRHLSRACSCSVSFHSMAFASFVDNVLQPLALPLVESETPLERKSEVHARACACSTHPAEIPLPRATRECSHLFLFTGIWKHCVFIAESRQHERASPEV